MHRPVQFRHHRAQRGPSARRLLTAAATAGHALVGVVRAAGADDRADRNQPVHLLGEQRKMLADFDAWHVGLDRLEFAAHFRRRVHLQIEEILVRRPARQEDHDDRFVRLAHARGRFGPQNLRQRQSAQRQPADFQKRPPRHSVAEARSAVSPRSSTWHVLLVTAKSSRLPAIIASCAHCRGHPRSEAAGRETLDKPSK